MCIVQSSSATQILKHNLIAIVLPLSPNFFLIWLWNHCGQGLEFQDSMAAAAPPPLPLSLSLYIPPL